VPASGSGATRYLLPLLRRKCFGAGLTAFQAAAAAERDRSRIFARRGSFCHGRRI
jgi:hypothetical protein